MTRPLMDQRLDQYFCAVDGSLFRLGFRCRWHVFNLKELALSLSDVRVEWSRCPRGPPTSGNCAETAFLRKFRPLKLIVVALVSLN